MTAPITYLPDILPNPDQLFKELQTLNWEKRDAPRQEYYCNDFGKPYVYGKGRGQREYRPQVQTAAITVIRDLAEYYAEVAMAEAQKLTGPVPLEVCFLNRYLDQSDQLGWHADNSPEMDDARPIVIVSLGVEREIWFRPWGPEAELAAARGEPQSLPEKLKLGHGSICVMAAGMQDTWQHRIPKASFVCGERISLTFRGYVPQES